MSNVPEGPAQEGGAPASHGTGTRASGWLLPPRKRTMGRPNVMQLPLLTARGAGAEAGIGTAEGKWYCVPDSEDPCKRIRDRLDVE
jgi:hypothetical protein